MGGFLNRFDSYPMGFFDGVEKEASPIDLNLALRYSTVRDLRENRQ